MGCRQDLKATGLVLLKILVELTSFLLYMGLSLLEMYITPIGLDFKLLEPIFPYKQARKEKSKARVVFPG